MDSESEADYTGGAPSPASEGPHCSNAALVWRFLATVRETDAADGDCAAAANGAAEDTAGLAVSRSEAAQVAETDASRLEDLQAQGCVVNSPANDAAPSKGYCPGTM
jgi:hypothetical protein